MATQASNISVAIPVTQAIERVKKMLFQPFDMNKWFVIGFCAWLARLGEAGGSANAGNLGSNRNGADFQQTFDRAKTYVVDNLYWILPLAIAVVVICVAFGLLMMWLNSRGKFMFLHCVALDKAEVSEPWHKFARHGNSLFLFRVVLCLIAFVPIAPLLVVSIKMIMRMVRTGQPELTDILVLVGVGLTVVAIGIVCFVILKLTTDFVVPIMFLRGTTCLEGWKELRGLISGHASDFVVYLLFQIVLAMACGAAVLVLLLGTCLLACCILIIPYLGAVLLLPFTMFQRSYSLYYLAQYGPEYDVFQPAATRESP